MVNEKGGLTPATQKVGLTVHGEPSGNDPARQGRRALPKDTFKNVYLNGKAFNGIMRHLQNGRMTKEPNELF